MYCDRSFEIGFARAQLWDTRALYPKAKKPELSRLDPYGALMGSLDKVRRYAWYVVDSSSWENGYLGSIRKGHPSEEDECLGRQTNRGKEAQSTQNILENSANRAAAPIVKLPRPSIYLMTAHFAIMRVPVVASAHGCKGQVGTKSHTHKLFKSPATSHHISIPGCV